jgi:DNA polymerase
MRLDKDYLMEMELWSHFEMRGLGHDLPPIQPVDAKAATATSSAPLTPTPVAKPAVRTSPVVSSPVVQKMPKAEPSAAPDPARLAAIANADWEALSALTAECKACALCKQRKQAVLGVGSTAAHWLFVGEGPGAEEDQTGEPFVGQAGKLLDAMLTAAGLQRGREVYIANVVKCRPPGNRTPMPEEAAACAPFLDRQIDLIRPKIIVALGKTAITRLTGADTAMAALRGRVHTYRDIPVIATYHPAYLLRNLPEKLKAWEDLQFAKATLAEAL